MTDKYKLSFADQCFQWASGFYCTKHVPDEWFNWDDEKQDEWLEDNKWEPFEYYSPKDLCGEIAALSSRIENCDYPQNKEENKQLKKQLKRLEESYEKLSNEYSDYVHTIETEEVTYL
tara:strand:+ start:1291 stop:1644 length:354 start_codon:yes stop_codon:yes gene_type:complete